ncbi:hypothetical protein MTO96_008532 [Rhipicephalus appendiculatus]
MCAVNSGSSASSLSHNHLSRITRSVSRSRASSRGCPAVPTAGPLSLACAEPPSVHRSGSYGAHGSKQGSSSNDGDMWTCLMRLFRIDVFKKSHLRHWLKTGSWKDVSSATSQMYACMHVPSAARA